ncbi:hypothetical protein Bca52824_087267 [Brassica carinata]|uniref:Uncharacterized protein n=1 Tax=Brassica carinata TaxID=52824 RepID=A0A8X7P7U2_BRACI|nr:hypothetical protein Bca52824_087267 [Brassica carinata]
MYAEQETKWERVPERGNKRAFSNRNHNKFEEGGSRNRKFRWEQTRRHSDEVRSRSSRATRGERSPLRGERSPVTLIPGELETGLDLVSEFLEDGTNTLEQDKINEDLDSSREEGMELGETDHTRTETDAGLGHADEFQNLTDGEGKDMNQVEAKEFVEEDMTSGIAEGTVTAAAEKKPGLRKPLFSVAGGNNSKFVQFLMSPRKRSPAKQSLCKEGGAKQVEEKGSSHPKQLPKP